MVNLRADWTGLSDAQVAGRTISGCVSEGVSGRD